MYTKIIPFKDFKNKPRNMTVNFNLTETEVFKLIKEFKLVFDWRDSLNERELADLDHDEVIEFYTAFEEILLTAWGVPSEDGLHFRKAGRYEFQESALFNAAMVMFVTEPEETMKLIDQVMPTGMEDLVRKADENLAEVENRGETPEELRREIEALRRQIPSETTLPKSPTSTPESQ